MTKQAKGKGQEVKGDTKMQENQELKNQLARALADYDNLKKRMENERNNLYRLASISVFLKLLPILDNLRAALKHVADSGIAIIVGELETLLKEEGLEEIKLKPGDPFDEKIAEVIEVVENKDKKFDNTLNEILLSGWRYSNGEVVRFAKVRVNKLKETNNKNE